MSEPVVAPYGGLLTRTLDEQNEREAKLKEQEVSVNVNGKEETVRPGAIFIRGVDNLSTEDLKAFIDYYLNYDVSVDPEQDGKQIYEPHPIEEQITFRIQWINDSSVNIVFQTHENSIRALSKISITSSNPSIAKTDEQLAEEFSLENNVQERETKPFNPIIQFKKQIDLKSRIGLSTPADDEQQQETIESTGMDEDESFIILYTRQSFQSDVKVKGAATYSRYYLLHGEPERRQRRPQNRRRDRRDNDNQNNRRNRKQQEQEQAAKVEEEDLFASKLSARRGERGDRSSRDRDDGMDIDRDRSRSPVRRAPEEDLFASRLRR